MIRIEEDWHQRSSLQLPLANELAEASDFPKDLVMGKNTHYFTVPRFGRLASDDDLELCEFSLNPF